MITTMVVADVVNPEGIDNLQWRQLIKEFQETTNKSSHSTCSDGSLLSMGSSEMDEDSCGQSSRHSSKLSLQEKRNLVNSDLFIGTLGIQGTTELELGIGEVVTTPLSHSAAKHKMAVKPKRTHGAPRRRHFHQIGGGSLPVTPEVNEDGSHSGHSIASEIETSDTEFTEKSGAVADATPAAYNSSTNTPSATQLKSASLPPGLAPTMINWDDSSSIAIKLSRSRSSATNRQLDPTSSSINENDEIELQQNKKEDTSFFGRLLSRRSGKKKKSNDDKDVNNAAATAPLELPQKRMDEKGRYIHEISKLSRNHPAARQRVEPINIPSECSSAVTRMHVSYSTPNPPSPPVSPKTVKTHIIPSNNNNDDNNIRDDNLTFKQPSNKVTALNTDDLMYQRKSLVRKSHSFRSTDVDDAVVPFSALDTNTTLSLPINLQTQNHNNDSNKKLEELNTDKSSSFVADESKKIQEDVEENEIEVEKVLEGNDERIFSSVLNINENKSNIGVLNKNLVQDVTNSSLIAETNDFSLSKVDRQESFNTKTTGVGVYIKASSLSSTTSHIMNKDINLVCDSDVLIKEADSSSFVSNIDENILDSIESISKKSSESIESISHQITIPVGASIINIINDDVDNKDDNDDDDKDVADNTEMLYKIDDHEEETNMNDHDNDSIDVISSIFSDVHSLLDKSSHIFNSTDKTTTINSASQMTVIASSQNNNDKRLEETKIKLPEPKIRNSNLFVNDELSSLPPFIPVPAPRLSKRDSVQQSPPIIPEFLKVQLNHIENKLPTKNVVLSKNSPPEVDHDKTTAVEKQESDITVGSDKIDYITSKSLKDDVTVNECDIKSFEEVEVKHEHIIAPPVSVAATNFIKPLDSVVKVTEAKQKSSIQSQQQQPVPNPRYSIVSITASGSNTSIDSSLSGKNKAETQIVRKKSVVKDANGSITEKSHSINNSTDRMTICNSKSELEILSSKYILRKKSFNKDMYSDDKLLPTNVQSSVDDLVENTSTSTKCVDEMIPKVVLRQKQTLNDVIIVETQQKNRKSSLDTLQQLPTKSFITNNEKNVCNSKNSNESIKEKYRNSFGSCDTLLTQDVSSNVSNTSEVVYRRKSLTSREVITKQHKDNKDDEPELLKVFARRSLKIKDNDINLNQNSNDMDVINSDQCSSSIKSRDSDKENECGDSPPEERKKIKDNFNEIKTDISSESIIPNIGVKTNNLLRTQRSISVHSDDTHATNVNVLSSIHKENNQNSYEKRQRSRTFAENQKIIEPPISATVINSTNQHQKTSVNNVFKEKEVELITKQETVSLTNTNNDNLNDENDIPRFKKIQQRKEEWEKRAQLAMMKSTHP
ncbi:uncharacterized protein LOC142332105 isoform X2 [Lycorma delicatula]|uniref:uncharacterized protein LOC142332105 isoform X2 n=1 Tax=Lycorma delicatula TaxID=130591 RepID=UPI003F51636B